MKSTCLGMFWRVLTSPVYHSISVARQKFIGIYNHRIGSLRGNKSLARWIFREQSLPKATVIRWLLRFANNDALIKAPTKHGLSCLTGSNTLPETGYGSTEWKVAIATHRKAPSAFRKSITAFPGRLFSAGGRWISSNRNRFSISGSSGSSSGNS